MTFQVSFWGSFSKQEKQTVSSASLTCCFSFWSIDILSVTLKVKEEFCCIALLFASFLTWLWHMTQQCKKCVFKSRFEAHQLACRMTQDFPIAAHLPLTCNACLGFGVVLGVPAACIPHKWHLFCVFLVSVSCICTLIKLLIFHILFYFQFDYDHTYCYHSSSCESLKTDLSMTQNMFSFLPSCWSLSLKRVTWISWRSTSRNWAAWQRQTASYTRWAGIVHGWQTRTSELHWTSAWMASNRF